MPVVCDEAVCQKGRCYNRPVDSGEPLGGAVGLAVPCVFALLQKPFVQAVANTAAFLKSQGKVDSLQADYSPYVSNQFVKAAK